MIAHVDKIPNPGGYMCAAQVCQTGSASDPRIDKFGPDAPPAGLIYHRWIVRMTYWGGCERRFHWEAK